MERGDPDVVYSDQGKFEVISIWLKKLRVGQSVESVLIALAAIFLAHFNNFRQKYRILTRRDKRESYLIVLLSGSYWLSPCLSLALYGSL